MYRVGGRESSPRYAGSFATKRDALARKAWVVGELAAMRIPDRRRADDGAVVTLAQVAARWQASRVDVAAGTLETYRVALRRVLPRLGGIPIRDLDAETVAALVADLHASGLKRQTIRKTVSVLAMALDHARIQPNPARDRLTVKLPREERRHVEPPTAADVDGVVRLLPRRYRLAVLASTAQGCASANSTPCSGETWTSLAGDGGSRRARPAIRVG